MAYSPWPNSIAIWAHGCGFSARRWRLFVGPTFSGAPHRTSGFLHVSLVLSCLPARTAFLLACMPRTLRIPDAWRMKKKCAPHSLLGHFHPPARAHRYASRELWGSHPQPPGAAEGSALGGCARIAQDVQRVAQNEWPKLGRPKITVFSARRLGDCSWKQI